MNALSVDCADDTAAEQFVYSLHHTGFAVLRNHSIPASLLDRIHTHWLQFFLSTEKLDYQFDPNSARGTQEGYVPPQVSETAVNANHRDLKEFFHVRTDGRLPDRLTKDIFEYRQLGLKLGSKMLRWLQEKTPESTTAMFAAPLSQSLCDELSLLRILHYPPLSGSEVTNAERAAPHEDINLLTILPVSQQPGLEIMNSSGVWQQLKTEPGEVIVNTGDMLQELTNGYYPSTTHRVVNPDKTTDNVSRISVPFFLAAKEDYVLSENYSAGAYLTERLEQLRRT